MSGGTRSLVATVLALASVAVLAGCASVNGGFADASTLTDKDLAIGFSQARFSDSGDYSEQLKIQVALEGGGTLYTRLLVTNIANADGRADLLTKLALPGTDTLTEDDEESGESYREKTRADRDEWTYGRERFDVTIGTQTIQLDTGGATVHVEGDGFVLDYTITPQLAPLRPTGGSADFGGVSYLTTVPIPRGTLTGTLTTTPEDGEPVITQLRGVAYVEHRLSNLAPYTMAQRWYKLSTVGLDETVVFSTFERAPDVGGGIQGWLMVANADGLRVYEGDLDVVPDAWSVDAETGYRVPRLLFVYDRGREDFRGVFKLNDITKRKNELKRLSRLERFVVKRFMKPWVFEHANAAYLFKIREGAGAAERSYTGSGRVEVQQLNPDP